MVTAPDLPPDLHPDATDDRHTRRFAGAYDRQLGPWQDGWLDEVRRDLLGSLTGTVVEVGAGTGLNLRHYRSAHRVVACEPSPAFRAQLRQRLAECPVTVSVRDWAVEDLATLPAGFADHLVCTLVLCSVDDPPRAAAGMRRALRPGGSVAVVEHVADTGVRGLVQRALTPLSTRYGANCHPHRHTGLTLAEAGFDTTTLRRVDPGGWWYEFPVMAGRLGLLEPARSS